jgi:hypothetical protein
MIDHRNKRICRIQTMRSGSPRGLVPIVSLSGQFIDCLETKCGRIFLIADRFATPTPAAEKPIFISQQIMQENRSASDQFESLNARLYTIGRPPPIKPIDAHPPITRR